MMIAKDVRLGPYEIQAPLGHGGMGEVYRAIDTRLGRAVAIKVLPRHVADSPTRRQRFEREARALSSLSHPHICALYDIGEEDGLPFLVMEALDGETLTERLVRGALPIDQVVRHAIEMAGALDHAHRQGVIHRDLKPSNIMMTRSGVKLLDFGVARLCATETIAGASLLEMPTLQTITGEETIVGTPPYMAPEQLEARDTDARTDIFAFGAVVYEMATGRQAFEGRSRAGLIAAILEHDPEPISSARRASTESTIPASTREVPPLLDQIIERCLAKDPGERWQTANDLEQALRWIAEGLAATVRAPQRTSYRTQLAWGVAVGLAGALSAIGVWSVTSRAPSVAGSVARFALSVPETDTLITYGLALSPNGRNIVYVAQRNGTQQLFRHALDQLEAMPIAGSEGGEFPFFSPDGQWIGFFADNALKKVAATGGTAVTICPAGFRRGASWGRDGMIVFASGSSPDLMQVAATGGAPKRLTTMATGKRAEWPELTPDGRAVLYTAMAAGVLETARVVVRSLDTGTERDLVDGTNPRLSPTGHVVFARRGELWAAPFDRNRLAITGAPTPVLEGVQVNSGGMALFAVASDGSLVHAAPGRSIVVAIDRTGRAEVLLDVPRVYYGVPQPSPEGHRLAMAFSDHLASNPAIWTYDLERHLVSRLTFGRGWDSAPLWTPDGQRIVFRSDRAGGPPNLFWTAADGSGVVEQLTHSPNGQNANSWTRDGQILAFTENDRTPDIWTLRVDLTHKPEPFLRTPYKEFEPAFSPDGRWIAYESNEADRDEIYVRPFPPAGAKWQVSTRGGVTPRWSPDGKGLFYLTDDTLMVAAVRPGPTFQAAAPRALFRHSQPWNDDGRSRFSVMPDGQHFLMLQPAGAPFQIQVTLNWVEELKARVPTK
jgi:serine/threonine protein kinase/Tol biopolymer transport system component